MININFTLLIQLVNFLVLLFILNAILFKPIMAKMRERDARIRGDREKAAQLGQTVEERERQHQEELTKARLVAVQDKTSLLTEAKKKETDILHKARNEAANIVERMKVSIQTEVGEVRTTLKTQMTPLAQSLAEKVLGRSI